MACPKAASVNAMSFCLCLPQASGESNSSKTDDHQYGGGWCGRSGSVGTISTGNLPVDSVIATTTVAFIEGQDAVPVIEADNRCVVSTIVSVIPKPVPTIGPIISQECSRIV